MKKIISGILSVVLAFSISLTTFAQSPNTKVYPANVTYKFIDIKTFSPLKILFKLFNCDFGTMPEVEKPQVPLPPVEDEKPQVPLPPVEDENDKEDDDTIISASEFELKVLDLVNNERAKHGLSPLVWDEASANVARMHSKDMAQRNFFSHTNPDGQSPFDRLKNHGISYSYAAENIAAGQETPESVVTAWMNSDGHRKNILNKSMTKLGVGYYQSESGYKHYWTQCFIG